MGVFTREGASNRKNGIVLFDASDPAHLKVLSEYTETVTGGVHSAFINTHYVYITDDATGSLRVIDFQDPTHPKEVARWQTEKSEEQMIASPLGEGMITTGRYLHDLYVKDGLAYLAYWRDGLVILDVGNGMKGGSPEIRSWWRSTNSIITNCMGTAGWRVRTRRFATRIMSLWATKFSRDISISPRRNGFPCAEFCTWWT